MNNIEYVILKEVEFELGKLHMDGQLTAPPLLTVYGLRSRILLCP